MATRYVVPSGGLTSGEAATEGTGWTLSYALSQQAAGDIFYVKGGAYSLSETLAISALSTSTGRGAWIGYQTTPGDLDGVVNSANRPVITLSSTYRLELSGTYTTFRNIDVVGDYDGVLVSLLGSDDGMWVLNCSFTNNSTGTSAKALSATGTLYGFLLGGCEFDLPLGSPGASNQCATINGSGVVVGCTFKGGYNNLAISDSSFRGTLFLDSYFLGASNDAITVASANSYPRQFIGCVVYNAGGIGISLGGQDSSGFILIENCIFSTITSHAISCGGQPGYVMSLNNAFHAITGSDHNGVDALSIIGNVTESSSPFTNAGSDDFSLVTGANSKATGFPSGFEGLSTNNYLDRGAAQRQEPAGGTSSILRASRLSGGLQ